MPWREPAAIKQTDHRGSCCEGISFLFFFKSCFTEFSSSVPVSTAMNACNPRAMESKDHWSLLDSQSSQNGELQVQGETCLKEVRWRAMGQDTCTLWPLCRTHTPVEERGGDLSLWLFKKKKKTLHKNRQKVQMTSAQKKNFQSLNMSQTSICCH